MSKELKALATIMRQIKKLDAPGRQWLMARLTAVECRYDVPRG